MRASRLPAREVGRRIRRRQRGIKEGMMKGGGPKLDGEVGGRKEKEAVGEEERGVLCCGSEL